MSRDDRISKQRILVMAQGQATRFPGKHFVPINGEPLLQRTLRLCRELTSREIVVIGWATDPFVHLKTNLHTQRDPGSGLLDGIWNTRDLWSRYTTILLGDVVFSRAALKRCLDPRTFAFFGRLGPNVHTQRPYGEIFGLSLGARGQKIVTKTIGDPKIRQQRGGQLWGLWDLVSSRARWCAIEDWTDDVDTPDDLEALQHLAPMIAAD